VPNKNDLIKELDWVTEKISSQVWTLNLGTMATTWSLLIASGLPQELRLQLRGALVILSFCVLALICELGQYLCAYKNALNIQESMRRRRVETFRYDERALFYVLRDRFFGAKIVLTLGGSLSLVIQMIWKLI
jgi:hypothetical protein